MEQILHWAGNEVDDMAFKYNIIKAFEDERTEGIAVGKAEGIVVGRAEGKAEGRAESIIELLEELGDVSSDLQETIMAQKDITVLKAWHKKAARVENVEEFRAFIEE